MTKSSSRGWAWPRELQRAGILGINARNIDYILEYNARRLYPRVDNKLLTKRICEEHGIPVPQTYAVLRSQGDVHRFFDLARDWSDFVIKPASGAGGRGIVVIAGRSGDDFKTPSGRVMRWGDLRYHLSTVISGLFSLGGQADYAIVEQRIISHHALVRVTVGGTPDIRVILFRGVPVMAMVRLPTAQSGGRANLHQGAIAAAVDLATGQTYGGVQKNRAIARHPDTGEPVAGISIPDWPALLEAAMRLGDALGLGYVGVDFVIDTNDGPVVLEANARPGLAIQVAHRQGLLKRLEAIERAAPNELKGEGRKRLIAQMATIA